MDDRTDNRGLTNVKLDLMTIELYWRELFPNLPVPQVKYFKGWLNRASCKRIMEVMDASRDHHNPSYRIFHTLDRERNAVSGRVERGPEAIHFDANGKRVTV